MLKNKDMRLEKLTAKGSKLWNIYYSGDFVAILEKSGDDFSAVLNSDFIPNSKRKLNVVLDLIKDINNMSDRFWYKETFGKSFSLWNPRRKDILSWVEFMVDVKKEQDLEMLQS